MFHRRMRTSVNLDADAHDSASTPAEAKDLALSADISELERRAEMVPELVRESGRLKINEHGYLVIIGSDGALTPEMVRESSEDELV